MNFAEKVSAYRLVMRVLDEYIHTGKIKTRLAPNVKRLLDEETQFTIEKINQGLPIPQAQIKSIGNRTSKLTLQLWEAPIIT